MPVLVAAARSVRAEHDQETRAAEDRDVHEPDGVYANNTSLLLALTSPTDGSTGLVATISLGLDLDATTRTAVDLDQQGLTGLWYDPTTDGQGFALEVFPAVNGSAQGLAQLGWFTFASGAASGAEAQRWYTLSGPMVAGAASASLIIYQNTEEHRRQL